MNQKVNTNHYNILPPMNVEIEKAIIGSMLQSKRAIEMAVSILNENMFYIEIHRLIFTTMQEMYLNFENIDILTVNEYLKNEKIYSKNVVYYLTECINLVSSDAMIEQNCYILKEYYIKRKLLEISYNIRENLKTEKVYNIITYINEELQDITSSKSTNKTITLKDLSKEYLELFKQQINNEKDNFVKSYIPSLDNKINGFQGGEYIVIAGRPGIGKTSLGLQIFWDNIKKGNNAGLITIESSRKQIFQRLISFESGQSIVNIKSMKDGNFEIINIENHINRISKYIGVINDSAVVDIFELKTIVKQMVNKYNIKLIVIDYLQLLEAEGESENVRLTNISKIIKRIAKEFNIPIFIISQLSRQKRDESEREPVMSDLRGSGSIEQDADIIIFLHKNKENKYKIIVAKRRDGAIGFVPMLFFPEIMRFGELDNQTTN